MVGADMRRSPRTYRRFVAALLVLAGLGLLFIGCGGDDTNGSATEPSQRQRITPTPTVAALAQGLTTADAEELSTFKSKDPFIQQAVEVSTTMSTTNTTSPGGQQQSTTTISRYSPTTTRYSPTTIYRPTTTTKWPGTTTSTKPPSTTTTTAPHVHTLKVLSVSEVNGAPAVTLQVDGSVYKDRRVGDVVSTSWGQIKVLDLSSSSKVATLLHGSETLTLSAGQVVYE